MCVRCGEERGGRIKTRELWRRGKPERAVAKRLSKVLIKPKSRVVAAEGAMSRRFRERDRRRSTGRNTAAAAAVTETECRRRRPENFRPCLTLRRAPVPGIIAARVGGSKGVWVRGEGGQGPLIDSIEHSAAVRVFVCPPGPTCVRARVTRRACVGRAPLNSPAHNTREPVRAYKTRTRAYYAGALPPSRARVPPPAGRGAGDSA